MLKRLCDLGFGDKLYSLEISKSGVNIIKSRNVLSLVECKLFDGYHIPYKDKKFDLAILSHVIEHVEHPRVILKEAGRVAKYVFVEVPLELHFRLPNNFKLVKTGHINFYNSKSIRYLLQTVNFKVVSQKITNYSFPVYISIYGKKAIFMYLLKEIILHLSSSLAANFFTYHCAILSHTEKNNFE